MKVLGRDKLLAFQKSHADSKAALEAWYHEAIAAQWRQWTDVRERYPSADLIGSKIVFNIKGNHYRLVVLVTFAHGVLVIDRIGTHAEYNRWKL